MLNSCSAVDFVLDEDEKSYTYKQTGGIFDIILIHGPSASSVIQSYHLLIGTPHLPPFWSLGWHQSRHGYTNLQQLEDVFTLYRLSNIPLDTLWGDVDSM